MSDDVDITRFGVAIIESLNDDEPHTGYKLFKDLLTTQQVADETLFYDYYSVATVNEFENAISTIISKLQPNEMLALHVEAHASDKGIKLCSCEVMTWKKFLSLCRELNIKEKGILVVTTAMCYSLPFMAHIDPTERAPFKAIVITSRDVSSDELLRGYSEYFSIYKTILDIGPAKEAMRREVNKGTDESSPFEVITSNWLFDQITNPDRDPDAFRQIVNFMYCKLKAKDISYTPERVESEIRDHLKRLRENGKDYFTFSDLNANCNL